MWLDYVRIDGFKNLNGVEIDFDERQLTTLEERECSPVRHR